MKHLLLILIFIPLVSGIRINELMYNPEGEDTGEFVEISGTNNLTGFVIGDSSSNDTLVALQIKETNYSLVVADGFNFSESNASIFGAGAKIGNGLGNAGDSIYLFFNNSIVHNVSYIPQLANGNGKSLEYYNGTFRESVIPGGTPGNTNSVETQNNNNNSNTSSRCEVSLDLELSNPKLVYEEGEKILFKNVPNTNSYAFVIEYEVVNIFNFPVREKRNTSNSQPKQFTPRLEESDRAFIIRNKLLFVNCSNSANQTKNEIVVVVRGKKDSCLPDFICQEHIEKINKLERDLTSKITPAKTSGGGGVGFFKTPPKISSFYTRKEKHEPKIKLFSNIKGSGFYEIKLTSNLEEFNQTIIVNESENVELQVNASKGRNLYIMELFEHNKLQDIKKLVVEFQNPPSSELQTKTNSSITYAKIEPSSENTSQVPESIIYEESRHHSFILVVTILAGLGAVVLLWKSYKEADTTKFL